MEVTPLTHVHRVTLHDIVYNKFSNNHDLPLSSTKMSDVLFSAKSKSGIFPRFHLRAQWRIWVSVILHFFRRFGDLNLIRSFDFPHRWTSFGKAAGRAPSIDVIDGSCGSDFPVKEHQKVLIAGELLPGKSYINRWSIRYTVKPLIGDPPR